MHTLGDTGVHTLGDSSAFVKDSLYRICCGANRLGDGGVHTLGDNSAFVNPAGQLLLPGGRESISKPRLSTGSAVII